MKVFFFALLPTTAFAHHGQDFFVTLDTRTPDIGHGSVFMASSWENHRGGDETLVEPGFSVGLGQGFSIGSTFQWSDETTGSWGYSGVTPILQWSFAVPDSPLRIGVSGSYHFADSSHTTGHSEATTHYHPPIDTSGPGSNPDAPVAGGSNHAHQGGHSHDHGGIHRHGEDHFQFRLIAEWQAAENTRLLFNIIAVGSGTDDIDFGYAVGVRRKFSHTFAVGVEGIGDFDTSGQHEVIAGIYYTPRHHVTVRLGAGAGLGPNSSDIALHSGVTWRF